MASSVMGYVAIDMRVGALADKGALCLCGPSAANPGAPDMARRKKVYEGKAKILYEGPEPGTLVQYFKDDATAFNAEKKRYHRRQGRAEQPPVGVLHGRLNGIGVPTHFMRRLNMREQLIRAAEIIPLEVIVRNVAAGILTKRLGIEEGTALPRPIIEFCYKDDKLGDPLVTEEHIIAFGWASQQDLDDIVALALAGERFLSGCMMAVGIKLVDFKIEVGRVWDGDFQRLILADEISPDSCRSVGCGNGQEAGQGCVPSGSGFAVRRLYRSRAPPGRHPAQFRAGRRAPR